VAHLEGQLQKVRTEAEIASKSESVALERLRAMEEAMLLEEDSATHRLGELESALTDVHAEAAAAQQHARHLQAQTHEEHAAVRHLSPNPGHPGGVLPLAVTAVGAGVGAGDA